MAHGARLVVVVGVVVALAAAAGCSADSGRDIEALENPTRTTLEPYVEPEFADTSDVDLAAVAPGPPVAFPVTIRGGDASLSGTLTGPDGPVARGRVRLERFVGETSAVLEVATDGQGRWSAKGILGGRYRVRGWRRPDVAMNSSNLLFLGAEEDGRVDLTASAQGEVDVQVALTSTTPTIDRPTSVTALITRHAVDADGIVQGVPLTGTVATITAGAGWDLPTPEVTVDAAGGARFTVTCLVTRPADLVVTAGEGSARITVPACLAPVDPSPTTTSPAEEPTAEFPVGSDFTPPFAGPLPPGTYAVVDAPASCALVFEVWEDGAWGTDRRTATGTDDLVLDTYARNLETVGDAPACTYERTA